MPIHKAALAILALTMVASSARAETQGHYGIGRPATDAEIAGWNIDIGRNGENLPPGSGTVGHGREVFAQQCAACHGDKGQGGVGERLVGGQGTIATREADQDRRQLLALCADAVRLYPPRHAAERAAIP